MSISYITLSRDESKFLRLSRSISKLHTDERYELIVIDGNKYNIFNGYNEGTRQAKYDYLCFIHDDVEILSNNILLDKPRQLLSKDDTGFLGVVGTRYLDKNGFWWYKPETCLGMVAYPCDVATGHPFGYRYSFYPTHVTESPYPLETWFFKAIVLDGLLMYVNRNTLNKLGGFDEEYGGYHYYDMDITLRAYLAGLTNYVIPFPVCHHIDKQKQMAGKFWPELDAAKARFLTKFGNKLPVILTS